MHLVLCRTRRSLLIRTSLTHKQHPHHIQDVMEGKTTQQNAKAIVLQPRAAEPGTHRPGQMHRAGTVPNEIPGQSTWVVRARASVAVARVCGQSSSHMDVYAVVVPSLTTSTVASTVAVMHHDHGMVNRRGSEVAIPAVSHTGQTKIQMWLLYNAFPPDTDGTNRLRSPPLALVNAQ